LAYNVDTLACYTPRSVQSVVASGSVAAFATKVISATGEPTLRPVHHVIRVQ
jgi:hypothetical protein